MTIKWGIIGTGFIAQVFTEEFDFIEQGKITAVASRSREKAEEFAVKNNIEKSYSSYKDLAEDDELDVVYIATPHNLHLENTLLCLNNDKHVLCEKPIAVNEKQTRKMFAAAKEKNLFLMEALWTYFLPPILKVKEWIAEGKIGEIRLLTARIGINPVKDKHNRLFDPNLAGGALLDTGIYPVALTNYLLDGEPKDINVSGYIGDTGVDEHSALTIKYPEDTIAQLTCSIQADILTEATIYGTRGQIYIPDFLRTKKAVLVKGDNKENVEDKRKSKGYTYEIEAVNQDIMKNNIENNRATKQITLNNMRILDKAREIIGLKYPFETE
ncbi:MAG: Gfo/Idh/MocA family oxidoreductase [Halanaerobiales bacterium]